MSLLFFARHPDPATAAAPPVPPPGCRLEVWRPGLTDFAPRDLPRRFHVWWLFHHLRVFRGRQFAVHLVRRGQALLHSCVVFPPFFRFPFMARNDVQIGDVWTAPQARRQGLGRLGAASALASLAGREGRIWYVTASDNLASVRLITGLGFDLVGHGERRDRFGLALAGYYHLVPDAGRDDAGRA